MATGKRSKKKNRNAVHHTTYSPNIGMIIFTAILIYLLYSIFRYATARHVVAYEVRTGSLQANNVYQGIALRTEAVETSDYAGYVNFYSKEKDRLANGELAYTVDPSGEVAEALSGGLSENVLFTADDYSDLQADITSFSAAFSTENFHDVYDFKDSIDSAVQKITNGSILASIDSISASDTVHYCNTSDTGYIVYSTDGYENKTFESITKEDFSPATYEKTEIHGNDLIAIGDPVYKLETTENWSIAIPLSSEEEAQTLDDIHIIKVRFLKNQLESWATIQTRADENGNFFANLKFTNSMIQFCTDRFVDVELVTDEATGLKIPLTALVDDDFYLVPDDFVTEGTGGSPIVLRQAINENGDQTTQTVSVDSYGTDADGNYYLGKTTLREGDILVQTDSSQTFTVGETAKLSGVYNVNKGYADFRKVTVVKQNDEYAIVEPDNVYGLREYDYIVLDATTMTPDEFIYE